MQCVHAKGPAAYQLLRKKLDNKMPTSATLRRHQPFTFLRTGEVTGLRGILTAFVKSLNPIERKVVIYFDEMSVSSNLYYDKTGDKVIGNNS